MRQNSLMMMLMLTWALSGAAQATDRAAYVDLEAQPLADALKHVAEVFDLEIAFFPEDVRDIEAPPLVGRYTADEALSQLLEDTGLEHRFVDEDSVAVVPKVDRPAARDEVHQHDFEPIDQQAHRRGSHDSE
jgi:hypothetical protein